MPADAAAGRVTAARGGVPRLARGGRRLLANPLVNGAGALSVAQYAATALGLLTTLLIARALGPNAYGVASLVIAYPSMVWAFSTLKPVAITTRYVARFRASGETDRLVGVCQLGYLVDAGMALVAFVLVAATAPWVAGRFYAMPERAWMMVVFAAFFPIASLSGTNQAVLTSFGEFRLLAVLRFARAALLLAMSGVVLAARAGITGYVLAMALSQAAASLLEAAAVVRTLARGGAPPRRLLRSHLREIEPLRAELRGLFGWSYVLSTATSMADQVPLLLLGRFAGPAASGFYRLAILLATGAMVPEASMAKVVFPRLAAQWDASGGGIRRQLRRWTLVAGLPAAGLVVGMLLLLPLLVPPLFGAGYAPMVRGAQVLFVATAIRAACFWLEPSYYAAGRVGLWTRLHVAQVAALLAVSWFAVSRFGFLGAAVTVAVLRIALVAAGVAALPRAPRQRPIPLDPAAGAA
jgi:O-antigen/teichoic acid export membrane protein